MKRRLFFITSIGGVGFVSAKSSMPNDKRIKSALRKIMEPVKQLAALRKSKQSNQDVKKILLQVEDLTAGDIEPIANSGDRHYQFYAGMLYRYCVEQYNALNMMKEARGCQIKMNRWLQLSKNNKHPGAMYMLSKGGPYTVSGLQLLKDAVKHGSLDALAEINGRTTVPRESWYEDGPLLQNSGDEKESLLLWMIIYFYLLRIDPEEKHFKLSFPEENSLFIPIVDPDFKGDDFSRLSAILAEARQLAGKIDASFDFNEIYIQDWLVLNFSD